MKASDVVAVLDCLDRERIAVWIDGGWGIDALVGHETRGHEDLDLVIEQGDLPRAQTALAELGFAHDPSIEPGLPARLALATADDRRVDLHPVVFDDRGDGWQPLGDGAWGAYPADGLSATGEVAGRSVRCLTPQLQLRHHLGYPPDENDRHDLRALAERFNIGLPPGF
jgi:lincosamide nucleotidyltransferase A/C/D/E